MADNTYTLAMNGSEARLQIAVGRASELIFSQEWFTPRQGMQVLIPALMDGLSRMGLTLENISKIAVVRGPGSFTGVRLVLSSALGLALPRRIPMAGIDYLPLLAEPAQLTGTPNTSLWAVTHARKGQVHLQGFVCKDSTPMAITKPLPATLEEAAEMIASFSDSPLLLGSGIRKNMSFFEEKFSQAQILPARYDHPAPATLLDVAETLSYSEDPVSPLYLRGCDAEENLPGIAAKKGLDPVKAQQALETLTSTPYSS